MKDYKPLYYPRRDLPENNYQYYLQYKELYQQSVAVSQYYKRTLKRQDYLKGNIAELNEKVGVIQERGEYFREKIRPEIQEFKKKKNRRTADQIQKQFSCPIQRCDRKYGTEASLRIHIKKKHQDIYKPKKRGAKLLKQEDSLPSFPISYP